MGLVTYFKKCCKKTLITHSILYTGHKKFTCPTGLTRSFCCRTGGYFNICNALFYYFYHVLRWAVLD